MKRVLKVFGWIAVTVLVVIIILIGFVQLRYDRKFDAPYPDIKASTDPAVIARGKYLVYGLAHCAACHVPMDKIMAVDKGLEIPLSGGWEEHAAGFGTFRAPNLTPDAETGIGKFTDGELARVIRYGVKPDGTFLAPFMLYQDLSDDDLTAIISFLRSQEPVRHEVEPTELSFVAKALVAFGILKPEGPNGTPPRSVEPDTTAAYGKYLASSVGNCRGCHVKIDNSGHRVGAEFSGGGVFPPNAFSKGYAFVSPNLTPDKSTGIIADWPQEHFVERFQGGRLYEGSPMPWGFVSRVDEPDLKAIYKFLHSLPPAYNKVEKTVYAPGEKLPE